MSLKNFLTCGRFYQFCIVLAAAGLIQRIIPQPAFADPASVEEEHESREHDAEDADEHAPRTIKLVAKGGVLTPSVLEFSVFDPITFELSAADADYTFEVRNTPIKYSLKKGSVTEISLATLGKGEYMVVCGKKCSGTIHVKPEVDDDDEEEDEAREKSEAKIK